MQNWEEFGLLNETPITQAKDRIENELEKDEEDNEVEEKTFKDLIDEDADKEEVIKEIND